MAVKLKLNKNEYYVETIIWDRDSYFIDSDKYWSRLIAAIAQKVAENTTNNWGNFNQVRTHAIKAFGINPESGNIEHSSPAKILSANEFSYILTSSLSSFLKDHKYDELTLIFKTLTEKAFDECKDFISESLNLKNINILKALKNNTENVLITNDKNINNDCFLVKSELEKFFSKVISDCNKDKINYLLKHNAYLLTNNRFLESLYKLAGLSNVILAETLDQVSFVEEVNHSSIVINIDGASRGNPGPASVGIVFSQGNKILEEVSEAIGVQTNNFAEYTALIRALEISLQKGYRNIEVKSDSELVVKQINKIYKVKDADIKELFDKANSLVEKLTSFKITHIVREENLKADKLANNALKVMPT